MQLKIVTNNNTFRFNQTGQAITETTEPFVLVEVYVNLLLHGRSVDGRKSVGRISPEGNWRASDPVGLAQSS